MSHIVYNTEGIVVGGINIREGDQLLSIFTKEFGLVSAIVKSVREERSKMRYALQQFSVADIALVQGRDTWRVTGALFKKNAYQDCLSNKEKRAALARITSLFRRLVRGEGKQEKLYELLLSGFEFLRAHELSKDEIDAFEQLIVLRMLYLLGYLAEDSDKTWGLTKTSFSDQELEKLYGDRKKIITLINSAIRETQL